MLRQLFFENCSRGKILINQLTDCIVGSLYMNMHMNESMNDLDSLELQ